MWFRTIASFENDSFPLRARVYVFATASSWLALLYLKEVVLDVTETERYFNK
jgi:hypothetical protein